MSVKVERSQSIAKRIIELSENNQNVIETIIDEFIIAETVRKINVPPSELKRLLIKNKSV